MTKYIKEDASLDHTVMTGEQLMESIERNVRTFSKDFNADCIFVGDGAATDGNTVYLPSLETDAPVTKRQSLVMGGYSLHETLHKLMTDFRWFKGKVKKWGSFTKMMHNAIEDVRIENGGKKLYSGLAKQIDKTAREVNRRFIDDVHPSDPEIVKDFGRIGPVAVTWAGRKALGYADESNEEALALLPKDIRKRVERIANEAMKLGTGVKGMGDLDQREAFNGCKKGGVLAERITKEVMDELTEEQKQPSKEEEGNKGEEEEGKGKGDGDNKSQDEGESDGDGDGEGKGNGHKEQGNGDTSSREQEQGEDWGEDGNAFREDDQADDAIGEAQGGKESEGEGDRKSQDESEGEHQGAWGDNKWDGKEPEPYDPNLDTILKDTVADINKNGYRGYRVWAPNCDTTNTRHTKEYWSSDLSKRSYKVCKDEAGPVLATIRRKLERVLLENKATHWQNGNRSGRLDVRSNAAKIVNYKPNVFRQRQDERVVNSALSIVIDQSGSMHGAKCKLAATTTIAICEALEPTNVPVEVLGHQMGEVPMRTERERKAGRRKMNMAEFGRGTVNVEPGYGRYNQLIMNVHKSFDDTLNQARGSLGQLPRLANGGNADGDAIRFAANRLLKRGEPRKVMFVLSDGKPSWYCDSHCNQQWTRDCVQWCIERGIIIVGLGIQDDSVKKFYPEFIIVENLDDFAKRYIDSIVKLLVGKNAKDSALLKTKVNRASRM